MNKGLKKLNKFTNTSSNTTTILLISFSIIYIFSSFVFYSNYKNNLIEDRVNTYNLHISNLNNKLDEIVLNHDKEQIKNQIEIAARSPLFGLIKLENSRFIFNKETLINNSQDFNDMSWSLGEVIVDIRYGFVAKLENSSLYEFVASSSFDISQPIKVRYQVYKNGQIKNIISQINFSQVTEKRRVTSEQSHLLVHSFINTNELNKTYEIKKQGYLISKITYNINLYEINQEIQSFMFKLILFTLVMYLPLLFVLGYYHKFLFKKYVKKPVSYLNSYLDDVLADKFTVIDKTKFEGTSELKDLTKKIAKLSTKVAALRNELNINKESLELKASSDTLTGLPNKNVFDFDIKSMYVSAIPGYVFIIKIEKLSQISENHDSGYINSFIQSYVNIVNNVVFKYAKDMKLYRFYGSKFAVVAKDIDLKSAKLMCEELISELHNKLSDIYEIPDDLVQIGGSYFDIYGTIDSLLKTTDKAYENSRASGKNTYYIITEDEIERNYTEMDSSVVEIIDRADFELNFIYDTYSFDDNNKLLMSEASPILIDANKNKISIGSFISIADKLKIADKFDKLVVVKTIAYIRGNDIKSMIAINLSMSSIKNRDFMKWLLEVLKANVDIIDKIVFSITSYTAYLNKDAFINFINDIHEVGARIVLKRYKTTEYPLEELQDLKLDFIRMSHEYTENFTNDVVKKHKVKNILIFAELYNIKVIADTVKLDSDFDLLERLGTYATSR